MLNSMQLRELIIKPTLMDLLMYTEDAVELMLFTCANESNGGDFLKQEGGPALGIYQMEPVTYNDIWQNYIIARTDLKLLLLHHFDAGRMPSEERLIYDLRYATAMTRIFYARIKAPLPNSHDIDDLWGYYKLYYNTVQGKATRDVAIAKYLEFIKE